MYVFEQSYVHGTRISLGLFMSTCPRGYQKTFCFPPYRWCAIYQFLVLFSNIDNVLKPTSPILALLHVHVGRARETSDRPWERGRNRTFCRVPKKCVKKKTF